MVNDTTRLPGLEGLAVVEVVAADEDGEQGPVGHLVTADGPGVRRGRCPSEGAGDHPPA
jgi:hypothetical protein